MYGDNKHPADEYIVTINQMLRDCQERNARAVAIIAALLPYVQPDMPPEWLRVLLDTGDVDRAWETRERDEGDFTPPPVSKFKRGDLVINKFSPALGVGRIDAYRNDGVYGVQYPGGYMLTNETDLLFARLDELPDETD